MAIRVEERANQVITELRQEGLSYGEMLSVIRFALSRLDDLRKVKRVIE